MLIDKQLQVQQAESVQLWKQVVRMVDGGEDICCALDQWLAKWSSFNCYSTAPRETTGDFRLFAMEFDVEFE